VAMMIATTSSLLIWRCKLPSGEWWSARACAVTVRG
jgi:hypothetical protein